MCFRASDSDSDDFHPANASQIVVNLHRLCACAQCFVYDTILCWVRAIIQHTKNASYFAPGTLAMRRPCVLRKFTCAARVRVRPSLRTCRMKTIIQYHSSYVYTYIYLQWPPITPEPYCDLENCCCFGAITRRRQHACAVFMRALLTWST